VKPDPHQEKAIELFLANKTFGCFDVPGSGKTAVGINALDRLGRSPALVTAPAHLVPQWRDQFIAWGFPPEEIAYTPRGCGPRERLEALYSDAAITVVSYEMWTTPRYRDELIAKWWEAYVFDEWHRLRRGGKRRKRSVHGGAYKAVRWLRTKTRSAHMNTPVWALTGTPIVRDATDVFPFLQMANPYRFSSRERFAQDVCYTSQSPYGLQIGKVRDPERFHRMLGKYSIRRSWDDIPELRELKIRHIEVPCEMSPEELHRHRGIKQDWRDPVTDEPLFAASSKIRALRRLAMPAKLDAVTEVLEDHPGRWLLVAWYKSSARDLQQVSRKAGRPTGYIDGTVVERERREAIETYKRNPNGVLVATIETVKEGFDGLQIGSQIIFAEQHYLSKTNEQAWMRLFRRNQTQPVLAYWLYARRSFDMRVRRVARKRDLDINEALGDFLEEEPWERT
jgi:superfamily II DNA or RNA helicase